MPPRQPDGTVENRHYVSGAGGLIGVHVTKSGAAPEMRYYHRDHLGSIVAITNEAGAVTERLAYEAFGKRRFPSGTADPNNNIFGVQTERGFTGHEHLDEIGLVHMNGRVYDPLLGRFMTADPFVQSPRNLQSYNRYSYVWNNPLSAIDPTGYSRWTNFRDNIAIPAAAITIAVFAPEISAFVGWTGGVEAGAAVAGGFSGSIGLSGAAASGMLGGALAGGIVGYGLRTIYILRDPKQNPSKLVNQIRDEGLTDVEFNNNYRASERLDRIATRCGAFLGLCAGIYLASRRYSKV